MMANVPDLTGNIQVDVNALYDALVAMKRDYDWALQNIDETNMTDAAVELISDSKKIDSLAITDTTIIGTLGDTTVFDYSIQSNSAGKITSFTNNITQKVITVT